MSRPFISILIAQSGNTDWTSRAVDSLAYSGEMEVLVWDDASPHGPGPIAQHPSVELVASRQRAGFGRANNELARRASGEVLVLLNNDVIVAPDCLDQLVHVLYSTPDTAAVVASQRGFDGRTKEMGAVVGRTGEAWQIFRDEVVPTSWYDNGHRVDYGSAACLAIRRADFLEIGGFDQAFEPAYYEDVDLCLRLRHEGLGNVLVAPRAVAFHYEGGTAGRKTTSSFKRFQTLHRGTLLERSHRELQEHPVLDRATVLRRSLLEGAPGRRALVLWLLPEMLKPDQSGGNARIYREIALLVEQGIHVVLWCERLGDQGAYRQLLNTLGVTWAGYWTDHRWPLDTADGSPLASVDSLLELRIWDGVVAWSEDMARRFGSRIRTLAPDAPYFVDSTIVLYRQCEAALEAGAALPQELEAEKDWELEAYRPADAIFAASEADAEELRNELPDVDVFTYDVGASAPRTDPGPSRNGSLLFLGNFLHPPNYDAITWWLEEISPLVENLLERPVTLRVVGAASETVLQQLSDDPALEVVGWVEDLAQEMSRARAFFVPLRYGAGTKDKIAVAMRYGVPTITTPIGGESMPTELFDAMWIEEKPRQLARAVASIMTDDRQWRDRVQLTKGAAHRAWEDQLSRDEEFVEWFEEKLVDPTADRDT